MAKSDNVYTYRCGKKIKLKKRPDQFVVRRLPDKLHGTNLGKSEQVSSGSSRVTCDAKDLESSMEESRKLAPTHHAYDEEETGQEFLITDRIMVTFKKPMGEVDVGTFAGKYALIILKRYSEKDYLFQLTNDTGMNPVKLIVKLTEEEDDVEIADHDMSLRMARCIELPDDSAYRRQWHLHRKRVHPEFDHRSSSRCEQAWQILQNFGSEDVVVAVTDDGCQLDHPDFDSENKFAGWGFFNGDRLVTRGQPGAQPHLMYDFGENHGTACAGVIAAEIDGQLTVGAAPGCRLIPIKWELVNGGFNIETSHMMDVLEYLSDKVDVVSNSWGSSPEMMFPQMIINRITQLAQTGGRRGKGIVFLWAAGNENCPIDHFAAEDVPFTNGWRNGGWVGVRTSRRFLHNLVGIPGVMHVAALASTAKRSHYSCYGTGIDVCAPSNNVHTYWRLNLKGLGITTTTGDFTEIQDDFGGTSSATPYVAGIAALVISANPQLTAEQVVSILKKTASKDLNFEEYPKTPPSITDPNPTWDVSPIAPFNKGDFVDKGFPEGTWSPWFGHGRVDAADAVETAKALINGATRKVRIEERADLDIPDADPAGIVSRIFISERGQISNLAIQVDIEHTYIGDLMVSLVGPDNQRIDLHAREGGSQSNLSKVYTEADTPDLAQLKGVEIRGPWTLEVSDHALIDFGKLKQWTWEADVLSDGAIHAESTPGLKIPDHDPTGIEDVISIPDQRRISDISVDVDITHTWIGDLKLELVHHNGDTRNVVLHSNEGRDADDIQHTYRIDNEPDLAQFVGRPANGDWVLKVVDSQGQDIGKLNRWSLTIE